MLLRLAQRGSPLLRAAGAAVRPSPANSLVFRASSRALCDAAPDADEARKAEVLEFLRSASRPIQGKAKAKQSAGQRAVDLTKQMKNLDDVDLHAILRMSREDLVKRGVPVQDRKRLMNFANKYVQGYRHDGRQGKAAWKGWLPPYKQTDHPLYVSHTGMRPFNNHVDGEPPAPPPPPEEPEPPLPAELLREWVAAVRSKEHARANELRGQMGAVGLDPWKLRPMLHPEEDATPETRAKLQQWLDTQQAKDYVTSDRIQDELRAMGIEPRRAMRQQLMRRGHFRSTKDEMASQRASSKPVAVQESAADDFWAPR